MLDLYLYPRNIKNKSGKNNKNNSNNRNDNKIDNSESRYIKDLPYNIIDDDFILKMVLLQTIKYEQDRCFIIPDKDINLVLCDHSKIEFFLSDDHKHFLIRNNSVNQTDKREIICGLSSIQFSETINNGIKYTIFYFCIYKTFDCTHLYDCLGINIPKTIDFICDKANNIMNSNLNIVNNTLDRELILPYVINNLIISYLRFDFLDIVSVRKRYFI